MPEAWAHLIGRVRPSVPQSLVGFHEKRHLPNGLIQAVTLPQLWKVRQHARECAKNIVVGGEQPVESSAGMQRATELEIMMHDANDHRYPFANKSSINQNNHPLELQALPYIRFIY